MPTIVPSISRKFTNYYTYFRMSWCCHHQLFRKFMFHCKAEHYTTFTHVCLRTFTYFVAFVLCGICRLCQFTDLIIYMVARSCICNLHSILYCFDVCFIACTFLYSMFLSLQSLVSCDPALSLSLFYRFVPESRASIDQHD